LCWLGCVYSCCFVTMIHHISIIASSTSSGHILPWRKLIQLVLVDPATSTTRLRTQFLVLQINWSSSTFLGRQNGTSKLSNTNIAVTIMIIELASVPPAREEWKLFSTKDN
jgi:hypothetical protein